MDRQNFLLAFCLMLMVAAYIANARCAKLEQRVRAMESAATIPQQKGGE
jgi:hypothetical protein